METTGAIRPATRDDIPNIARTVGAAFADYPTFTWLVPDAGRRAPGIEALYRRAWSATWDPHRSEMLTTLGGAGMVLWRAPGQWKTPLRDQLRGLRSSRQAFGLATTARIAKLLSAVERHHPVEEHWYLELLATHPDYQRRGVASALLAPKLAQCDADGMPVYLETLKPDNVAFYRHHGFVVRDELDPVAGGPHAWLMWREPRS